MKLTTNINLSLILPLFVGMVILGVSMIILIYTQSHQWISRVEDLITSDEISAFETRAFSRAAIVGAVIQSFQIDIFTASTYAIQLFRSDLPNELPLNVSKPYPSYFGAQVDNPPVDPVKPPLPEEVLFSMYFNVNITTSAQLNALTDTQSKSTVLDNVLRILSLNKPTTFAIYAGFEDYGWRRYPYLYNESLSLELRTENVCNVPLAPAALRGVTGFVPACRPWYYQAVSAATSSAINNGLGPIQFTPPYVDFTTKRVLITTSQAFFTSSGLLGVMGLDVDVDNLNSVLTSSPILTNGYLYMIDNNGTLIIYPTNINSATTIDIYSKPTPLEDAEFNGDAQQGASFLKLAKELSINGSSAVFTKDGAEWRLAAAPVNGTSYIVCVVVPSSDINALSTQLHSQTNIFGGVAIGLVVLALLIIICATYFFCNWIAERLLRPIIYIGRCFNSIEQKDLGVEMEDMPAVVREINSIYNSLRNLLVAVRYGNESYYANDLQEALNNYEAAEKLMRAYGNKSGIGVCQSNKGNVYHAMDNHFGDALKEYTDAINNAESELEALEALSNTRTNLDEINQKIIKQRDILAYRYMNIGILYKDFRPTTEIYQRDAEEYFNRSKNLFNDNIEGKAQVDGNLGQLYLDTGREEEARTLIQESFEVAKERGNHINMQYALMNLGMLYSRLKEYEKAIFYYTYVLQKFETVIVNVQRVCCEELIRLYELIGKPDLARAIRKNSQHIFNPRPKDIGLCLDCSGSMREYNKIGTCRENLREIVQEYSFDSDRLSLTIFRDNHEVIWPLWYKENNTEEMFHLLKLKTTPDGNTAFWDALLETINSLASETSSPNRILWIIALTDGMDNSSKRESRKQVLEALQKNKRISLLVITVGPLDTKHEGYIREACHASRNRGLLVKAEENTEDIKNAFITVTRKLGNPNVEKLSFVS